MSANNNRVVLIGRPNTGKSTLFNTILHEKKAITSDIAGTTRDIISAECDWQGNSFTLLDTAGLKLKTETSIEDNVQAQAEAALKKADVIIFVVDIRTGPTPQEINLAKELRKKKIPVILAINKADGKKWRDNISQFDKFGLDQVVISSIQGIGVGDLLDKIAKHLKKKKDVTKDDEYIKVGILGKPNAGKSSLFNKLVGEKKVVVSDMPGTTRDAVDTKIKFEDDYYIFYDTAGIKRRTKIKEEIERYSIGRSLRVIRSIDIALFLIDVNEPITKQDLKILNNLVSHNKAIIIIANKWDLIVSGKNEKFKQEQIEKFTEYFKYHLKFLYWAPVIFTSVKTGTNINKILPFIKTVYEERKKVISSDDLKEFMKAAYKKNPPPRLKKKNPPQIKKFTQIETNPPIFSIKIKETDIIRANYLKYIEKELRKKFGFIGTTIEIKITYK